MTTQQKPKVILCTHRVCNKLHYEPDCYEREHLRGPHGAFPKPLGGCSECWYGPGWAPHTHDGSCDLMNVPVSNLERKETFVPTWMREQYIKAVGDKNEVTYY